MGLLSALSGRTYALNTTVKGEADKFKQYANNFEERSFLNTFFKSMCVGSQMFCSYLFECKIPNNFFRDNIKNIDSKKANNLMKILASFYLLNYMFGPDAEEAEELEFDGDTPQDIQEHVYRALNFEQNDEEMFSALAESIDEDYGRFLVYISMLIQMMVLDLPTKPDVYFSEAVGKTLADGYTAFRGVMSIYNL